MREIVRSIELEFLRYKGMAEGVISQLDDDQLATRLSDNGNSIATLVFHISGNLKSRFTDFFTSDGEKPWREREEEFADRHVSSDVLLTTWEEGWVVLLATLANMNDADLSREVTIRQLPLKVHEALHRSLAHLASHVGQMVLMGKTLKGDDWHYLSIPPGQSDAYNRNPTLERPPGISGEE